MNFVDTFFFDEYGVSNGKSKNSIKLYFDTHGKQIEMKYFNIPAQNRMYNS